MQVAFGRHSGTMIEPLLYDAAVRIVTETRRCSPAWLQTFRVEFDCLIDLSAWGNEHDASERPTTHTDISMVRCARSCHLERGMKTCCDTYQIDTIVALLARPLPVPPHETSRRPIFQINQSRDRTHVRVRVTRGVQHQQRNHYFVRAERCRGGRNHKVVCRSWLRRTACMRPILHGSVRLLLEP